MKRWIIIAVLCALPCIARVHYTRVWRAPAVSEAAPAVPVYPLGGTNLILWMPYDAGDVVTTNFADRSTAGHNGTSTNAPVWTNLLGGYCVFDGVANHIRVEDTAALDIGVNDFTLAFWFAGEDNGAANTQFIDKRKTSSPYNGYTVYHQTDDGNPQPGLHFQISDGTMQDAYSAGITNALMYGGKWNQVTITLDRDSATGAKWYWNGRLAKTHNYSSRVGSLANTFPLLIGRDTFNGSPAEGNIDDVIIITNALSAAEVDALFWRTATTNQYSISNFYGHGWFGYDYSNRSQWTNTYYSSTFTVDNGGQDASFIANNHGTKGAGAAAPTWGFEIVNGLTNGYYSFDGGDYLTNSFTNVIVSHVWWGATNGWHMYAEVNGTQYVDAAAASFVNDWYTTNGNSFVIGRNLSGTYLTGTVSTWRAYSTLPVSELTGLYNWGRE